jgi:hypothetical protein
MAALIPSAKQERFNFPGRHYPYYSAAARCAESDALSYMTFRIEKSSEQHRQHWEPPKSPTELGLEIDAVRQLCASMIFSNTRIVGRFGTGLVHRIFLA